MITVEEAGRFIAPSIGKRWPHDKESIMDTLYLAAEEIWQSGKFKGSTKWFYVSIRNDNTIITPHGYSVLLGCNQNFKPINIRSEAFLFHQNGPGDLPAMQGYSHDVYDLGEYPVFSLIERLCGPCSDVCNEYRIAAKMLGSCDSYPETRIYGNDSKGNPIYSFVKPSNDGKDEVCQCTKDESDLYNEAIEGISIKLTNTLAAYDINFSSVTGIVKEATNYPVEYYAVDSHGLSKLIARLEPFEVSSSYRIYKVPYSCIRGACVLGLFKIKKPERYVDGSQPFITDNLKAALSIAMGVDKKYKRDEIQMGQMFIADGLVSLANEVRENNSNAQNPLQVSKSMTPRKRKFL